MVVAEGWMGKRWFRERDLISLKGLLPFMVLQLAPLISCAFKVPNAIGLALWSSLQ